MNIKSRCINKNNSIYDYYGGRGISICNEWKNDFMAFYDWAMTNGYNKELSIDRIDNNGNYEPNNCRWTTREIQSRNTRKKRKNNTNQYRGIAKNRKRWSARISVNGKPIHLGTYDTQIEAAKVRDKYIIDNNLEHTLNDIL